MILNGSAHVFLILKKKQQTIPNNDQGTQKKTWNVKCNKTIAALHFVQYDVEHYSLCQYCFSVLHNTSYRTQ
jgi:hypothetical protein